MTTGPRLIVAIILMAVATALTRFLPFLLFGRGKEPPSYIDYLGHALPPAMMALLVVYCLRTVDIASPPHGLAEGLACAAVVGLHLWRKNTLISIFGGTVVYMLLVQMVFV